MLISKALFLSWKLLGIRKYFHQNEILIVIFESVVGPDKFVKETSWHEGVNGDHLSLSYYQTQSIHDTMPACTCMGVQHMLKGINYS